jgi:hypothetical protein
MTEKVYANGIDAITGKYLLEPLDVDEFAAAIVERTSTTSDDYVQRLQAAQEASFGADWELNLLDLSEAGWGVVFATDEQEAVKSALSPLLSHRAAQVGEDTRFHILDHRPGETFAAWLARYGPAPGTVDPTLVPYYLLLVGSPERIPFEFQYLLDVEYAVGRIHFDDVRAYASYAESLVDYEKATTPPHEQSAVFFGSRHLGDRATMLSADELITPLGCGVDGRPPEAIKRGYRSKTIVGDDGAEKATRAKLLNLLDGRDNEIGRPALVFTATHGLGLPADHPQQRTVNGSLLCQDWRGGPPTPAHGVSAADVADARVHGLIGFFFACYSAGTPLMDEFPGRGGGARAQISSSPFVAALPQALLGHPRGGALATIGHVERAWGCSIASAGRRQLQPYTNALGQILAGRPVGIATRDFSDRYAVLSASLANLIRDISFGAAVPSSTVVNAWLERTDAQDFVVLGDPVARLRKAGMA